ncbi:MAG: secondary thiamine-phosphate synthase enzyme YjbQ [Candidatus Diapherotrites archaeon]|nr:secondary thiamine-phosphate synthase enzyme YjbQ [Candidatus Diapherotrites archaeon]
MRVVTEKIKLKPTIEPKMLDITKDVQGVLDGTGMKSGQALIFVPGSTAGVTTIEYEAGLQTDFREAMDRVFPRGIYHHDEKWGDGNGFSHIRASMLKSSLTVPFDNGDLLLGTWQQIVFCEFDNKKRNRELVVQFTGE